MRTRDIQDSFLSLIGWRQSQDTTECNLTEVLTTSESGLYYQDAHPLLTLQNLQSIAPDYKNVSYPAHSTSTSYLKGAVVDGGNNKLYKSVKKVPKDIALDNTEYWVETYPFSEWLEVKTRAFITKAVMKFVNEKMSSGTLKTLCERKTLFDGTGRIYDTINNKQNLVGFEIVPIRSKGVTTKINRIGLQFTEAGNYTVYVMHSSKLTPYYVETFEKKKPNSLEWFTPANEICLPYEGPENDAGGSWYICYKQSDNPENSKAIRKSRDWSKGPCNECSRHEYETWKIWSKYIEVHPFYVNEEFVTTEEDNIQLWDIEKNLYTYNTNYGINLDITVSCDVSDFIIEQRVLFQDYLHKSVAADFLREFAYNANVRTNRHSINASRPDILYEIDGDSSSMKESGLSYQLNLALKALRVSTNGIDRICQPCKNNGLKYRTV